MEKHLYYYSQHLQYSEPTNKPAVSYCEQEDEVHYHPDPFNGHGYVDLGLPSGTLWAVMNVGANIPTNYGLYFAWGETEGYADASTKEFSWDDYKFNPSGDSETFTKYNSTDGKTVLDLEDDAAHVNMGGNWHMPTQVQCEELLNTANCTSTWVTVDGVNGRMFTSVKNGNKLFIPAAGSYNDGGIGDVGDFCTVWSSSNAKFFSLNEIGGVVSESSRCNGYSIRGVVTPTRNLIAFTIDGTSYQAEEGMTWQQWVDSNYNTGGFYIDSEGIAARSIHIVDSSGINFIDPQDAIIANYSYRVSGATNDFD